MDGGRNEKRKMKHVNKYDLQNSKSRKCAHKICEYPDCTYQSLKPDICNIKGCNNKLHHMCQQDHDAKYWNNGLEDKLNMLKVCYTCGNKEMNSLWDSEE